MRNLPLQFFEMQAHFSIKDRLSTDHVCEDLYQVKLAVSVGLIVFRKKVRFRFTADS